MTEKIGKQRMERLLQEQDIPALLTEAQQLLVLYLDGNDDRDLEPLVRAASILQDISSLFSSQKDQEKDFPLCVGLSRKNLKDIGLTNEEVAVLTDDDLRWMTVIMAQNYLENLYTADMR